MDEKPPTSKQMRLLGELSDERVLDDHASELLSPVTSKDAGWAVEYLMSLPRSEDNLVARIDRLASLCNLDAGQRDELHSGYGTRTKLEEVLADLEQIQQDEIEYRREALWIARRGPERLQRLFGEHRWNG